MPWTKAKHVRSVQIAAEVIFCNEPNSNYKTIN